MSHDVVVSIGGYVASVAFDGEEAVVLARIIMFLPGASPDVIASGPLLSDEKFASEFDNSTAGLGISVSDALYGAEVIGAHTPGCCKECGFVGFCNGVDYCEPYLQCVEWS